jgi:oligosaccharide repeat unit polymerase
MDFLVVLFSVIVFIISIIIYKLSYSIFTFSSWIYTQSILLPYIGSVIISMYTSSYFFLYIFFGLIFYFLGFLLATIKYGKYKSNRGFNLYNPLNRRLLNYSISISFLISLILLFNHIITSGMILENKDILETILSTSGYRRIAFGLYSGTAFTIYAILGLILYKIYRCKKYLYLTFISISIAMTVGLVFGSKVAAIVPILLFAVSMYYLFRNIKMRYILLLIPISIILTIIIVKHVYLKETSASYIDIITNLLSRATTITVVPVYFIIYEYTPNYGLLYGKTFLSEIIRILEQLSGNYSTPLFSEIINNLINELPLDTVSRISAATKVFGVGYANFGLPGAFLYSMTLGYFVQYFNLKLLNANLINLFSFLVLFEFSFLFMGGVAESGLILISFQGFLLQIIPIITLLFIVYIILALPFGLLKFKILKSCENENIMMKR